MSSKEKTAGREREGSTELLTTPKPGFKFSKVRDGGTKLSSARTDFKLGRDRKEESNLQSIRSAFSLEEPERRRSRVYSANKTCSCKQFVVTLTFAAIVAFLLVLVNDVVLVAYLEHQNQQLKESDSKLAQDAQVGDIDIKSTLTEQIRELESNFTIMISDLEENYLAELRVMEEALNTTEERLVNATVMIVALEERHSLVFEAMQKALNATEKSLRDATAKISQLEDNHSAELETVERKLNATTEQLQEAKVNISGLELELGSVSAELSSLNASKASVVAVSELTESLALLDAEKASRTQLETLKTNLSSLAENSYRADDKIRQELAELSDSSLNQTQIQDIINMFASTKANQSDFEDLVSRVTTFENSTTGSLYQLFSKVGDIEEDIAEFAMGLANTTLALASKADQHALESVSHQLERLSATAVKRSEFESLSANLTQLRETVSSTEQELREDINDLADGTINRTHHCELQDIINMFAATKANLSDFVALKDEVSMLSASVKQTTLGVQGSIGRLNQSISSLERADASINGDLATKAEEQEVSSLASRVTTLESDAAAIRTLKETVDSLKTSKADESELDQVKRDASSLDQRVTAHTSSSQKTLDLLKSNVTMNVDQIGKNVHKISGAEEDISQLETQLSASSPVTTASWVTIVTSISMATVTIFMTLHPY